MAKELGLTSSDVGNDGSVDESSDEESSDFRGVNNDAFSPVQRGPAAANMSSKVAATPPAPHGAAARAGADSNLSSHPISALRLGSGASAALEAPLVPSASPTAGSSSEVASLRQRLETAQATAKSMLTTQRKAVHQRLAGIETILTSAGLLGGSPGSEAALAGLPASARDALSQAVTQLRDMQAGLLSQGGAPMAMLPVLPASPATGLATPVKPSGPSYAVSDSPAVVSSDVTRLQSQLAACQEQVRQALQQATEAFKRAADAEIRAAEAEATAEQTHHIAQERETVLKKRAAEAYEQMRQIGVAEVAAAKAASEQASAEVEVLKRQLAAATSAAAKFKDTCLGSDASADPAAVISTLTKRVESLSGQTTGLSQQLQEAHAALSLAQQEANNAKDNSLALLRERDQAVADRKRLQEQYDDARRRADDKSSELAGMTKDTQSRLEAQRQEYERALDERSAVTASATAAASAGAAAAGELESLRHEVFTLKAQAQTTKEATTLAVSTAVAKAKAEVKAEYEARLASADSRWKDSESKIAAAEAEARDMASRLAEAHKRADDLLPVQQAVASAAEETEKRLADMKAQYEAKLSEASEKESKLRSKAGEQFESLRSTALAEVEAARAAGRAEGVAEGTAQLDALRKEYEAKLSSASGSSSATAAQLETQLGEAKAEMARVQGSLAQATAQLQALEADKRQLQAALEAAQRDVAATRASADTRLAEAKAASEAQVTAAKNEAAASAARVQQLQSELTAAKAYPSLLAPRVATAAQRVGQLKTAHAGLRSQTTTALAALQSSLFMGLQQAASIAALQKGALEDLSSRYKREMTERRRLHNLVQELRGNIRVYARVRPVLPHEASNGDVSVASFPDEESLGLITGKSTSKLFNFDRVFPPTTSNNVVFEDVEGLVTSALDGYNVCIFAYGQTGSGKTHTMEGNDADRGINYRALDTLFARSSERRSDGWKMDIGVSMLEIYRESIRDMLAPAGAGAGNAGGLAVREMPGGGVFVQDLSVRRAASTDEILAIMKSGYKNRTTFSTNMNEHSSRSHAVLTVMIIGTNSMTGQTLRGKLHLVDLAGSERVGKSGVTGDRLKEAQAINKSLSALGDVIAARSEKRGHVPYRNSTLTWLLSDSLGGDSKTLMFVNIAPTRSNAEESVCSLNFAQRVKTVELGKATKHVGGAGRAGGPAAGAGTPGPSTPATSTGDQEDDGGY